MINSVVIIGGGSSSYYICRSLRSLGFNKPIIIITEEFILPYNRVLLPRILRDEIGVTKAFFEDSLWYKQNNITVYGGIAARINSDDKTNPKSVLFSKTLQTSSELFDTIVNLDDYHISNNDEAQINLEFLINQPETALIIATGGDAYKPTEYTGIESIVTWRTLEDTLKIHHILKKNTGRLGVVGGSFIGIELALAAQHHKADFDWIIKTKGFLRDGLDKKIQKKLLSLWLSSGTKTPLFSSSISRIENLTDNLITGFINGNKEKIYNHLLLGAGITPSLVTKKFPLKENGIYYAGDMVEIEYLGNKVQTGSFNQAIKTARYIAQDIVGELDITSKIASISQDIVQTPYQIKFRDTSIRLAGLATLPEYTTKTISSDNGKISQFWYTADNTQVGLCTL